MKDFFEDHLDLIVIIILCVVVSVSIFFGYRYDKKHYVTEESLMIIEIEDLEDHKEIHYYLDSEGKRKKEKRMITTSISIIRKLKFQIVFIEILM